MTPSPSDDIWLMVGSETATRGGSVVVDIVVVVVVTVVVVGGHSVLNEIGVDSPFSSSPFGS